MNKIVITQEGNNDGIRLENGKMLYLSSIRPEFVKRIGKNYKIVFVGMYTIRKKKETTIIYSLPKYFPKDKCNINHLDEIKTHIKKISKVVEKLRKEGKNFEDEEFAFNPYKQNGNKEKVNRFELAEYIIEDYLQNGLYIKEISEIKKGGKGRTSWSKTVAKISPIIQGNEPIYLNLMNKIHIMDEEDIISIIHANVLNQCLDFIGALIAEGITYIETDYLGDDLSEYTGEINAYSTYVFKEREINLFKALEAWCTETKYYECYTGVTCFHKVWELVNDFVWGNIKDVKSSNPIYYLGNEKYSGVGDAIPDTIRIEPLTEKNQKKRVYIFDSKYYTVNQIDKENIKGFPANSDIVKQISYLKLLKSQFEIEDFSNIFLLPECLDNCEEKKNIFEVFNDEWFRNIGYAEQGKFENLINILITNEREVEQENRVLLVMEKPDKLYDKYLRDYKTTAEDLKKILETK